jgi:hypothetical protein
MNEKMFRESDEVIVCKQCHAVVSVGYNILMEEEYISFKEKCVSQSLCPSCMKKSRVNAVIDIDSILLETAKNMIAVGAI